MADRVCTFFKYCDSSRLAQREADTLFDETVFRKDAAANDRQRQPVRGLLDPAALPLLCAGLHLPRSLDAQ